MKVGEKKHAPLKLFLLKWFSGFSCKHNEKIEYITGYTEMHLGIYVSFEISH